MIGVGYRRELDTWIQSRPPGIACLEITAEHFFGRRENRLAELASQFHLFVHGLGLSLGTAGPLDKERVDNFARVCEIARPDWISEHIAFTRTSDVDLGHLNPIQPTRANAALIADHAREVMDRCGKPMILENITSHLRLEGDLSEPEFLNHICFTADCGLLLDVTNLFINSRNHCFDPLQWLDQLDVRRIKQMHIVGYSEQHGRYVDDHARAVQPELIDLAREVVRHSGAQAIILERDTAFPGDTAMQSEISKLEAVFAPN